MDKIWEEKSYPKKLLEGQALTKVLVVPDVQIPYQDNVALAVVEKYMASEKWDLVIYIGDFIDCEGISHYNKGKPRALVGVELEKEFKIANDILDRHQKIIRKRSPKAKFHFIYGNHEERVEKWLDENPALAGLIDIDRNLRFKERGFTWTRHGDTGNGYVVGKATFTHGESLATMHTQKMAQTWGENVFYGHIHDVQSYTMTTRKKDSTRIAQSLGCLCIYALPYVDRKPTRWQQAITTFYFQPDGTFNHYVSNIVKGEFISPGGKHFWAI